ncbi:MAG: sugar transferase [Anaerolineales bacterium]|nr:sugar transferase [Anaerolineales bacterium]
MIETPGLVPLTLYFLFPLIWVLIYSSLSIYDGRKYLRVFDEFSALTFAMLIASVSAAGILYLSYRQVSRALFLLFILIVYLICLAWRVLIRIYFRSQKTPPEKKRHILVVGAGALGQKVKEQLLISPSLDLAFEGFVDDASMKAVDPTLYLGAAEEIREVLNKHSITDVVIALPHSAYYQMGDIVQRMEDLPVRVWVALGFFDLALYKTSIEDFAGIPMLDLRASAMDDYQHMLKRGFDVTFGLAALALALPLMAFSALLVYLDDGAPIFFKQARVGANGHLFEMLKFRTMVRKRRTTAKSGREA